MFFRVCVYTGMSSYSDRTTPLAAKTSTFQLDFFFQKKEKKKKSYELMWRLSIYRKNKINENRFFEFVFSVSLIFTCWSCHELQQPFAIRIFKQAIRNRSLIDYLHIVQRRSSLKPNENSYFSIFNFQYISRNNYMRSNYLQTRRCECVDFVL